MVAGIAKGIAALTGITALPTLQLGFRKPARLNLAAASGLDQARRQELEAVSPAD